eukprot:5156078-Pyramimonas_sp.AAC.1
MGASCPARGLVPCRPPLPGRVTLSSHLATRAGGLGPAASLCQQRGRLRPPGQEEGAGGGVARRPRWRGGKVSCGGVWHTKALSQTGRWSGRRQREVVTRSRTGC